MHTAFVFQVTSRHVDLVNFVKAREGHLSETVLGCSTVQEFARSLVHLQVPSDLMDADFQCSQETSIAVIFKRNFEKKLSGDLEQSESRPVRSWLLQVVTSTIKQIPPPYLFEPCCTAAASMGYPDIVQLQSRS